MKKCLAIELSRDTHLKSKTNAAENLLVNVEDNAGVPGEDTVGAACGTIPKKQEKTLYPLLGAVTRIKNEISERLPNRSNNLESIKGKYKVFLTRLETLQKEVNLKNCNEWYSCHHFEISQFRERLEKILYPTTAFTTKPPSTVKSKISNLSVASAKIKIAEKRAKIMAQKTTNEKMTQIKMKEVELKENKKMN